MKSVKVFLLVLVSVIALNNVYAAGSRKPEMMGNKTGVSSDGNSYGTTAHEDIQPKSKAELEAALEDTSKTPAYKQQVLAGYLLYTTMFVANQFGSETAGAVLTQLHAFLAADLLTASFHWLEDTYFTPDTPIIGGVIQENIRHHKIPAYMAKFSFYETLKGPVLAATIVGAIIVTLIQDPNYAFILPFLGWSALTNQIHKFEHMPASQRPWLVKKLQGYFIQSCEEHKEHHTSPYDKNYCVLSPFLNPILEGIGFWRGLENIVETITGVPPRLRDQITTAADPSDTN